MDIYNRGQWGKDEEYRDEDVEWKGRHSTELNFKDYEESAEIVVGDEYGFHIRIYCAEDVNGKYPFFADISTGNRSYWYLVTDFPSVLMLIKEVLPIINEAREREAHEIQTEEHEWKVKGTEQHLYRKNCAHVS